MPQIALLPASGDRELSPISKEQETFDGIRSSKDKNSHVVAGASHLSVTLFFSCWEAIAFFGIVPETMLASPGDVLRLFVVKLTEANPDGAVLSVHVWTSIQEAFTGYLLSLLFGIPIGLFMDGSMLLRG